MKAKIWNHKRWVACADEECIKPYYRNLLKDCGFWVIGEIEHRFEPQGYTVLFLLGESHLAVHTFPEHNKMYIELSSCNKEKYKKFIKSIGIEK